MENITLQRATELDLDDYIAIEKKVTSRTYASITDEDEVKKEFENSFVYMIKQDNKSVGIISYEIKEDESVYISGLSIDPDFQGQGIGRISLTKILNEVKSVSKVWLITHPDNSRAIKLYESLNFKIIGRKENYFGDGEPRIFLEKQ